MLRQHLLDLPAPTVAAALGYHQVTTSRLAADAGTTWSNYAPSNDGPLADRKTAIMIVMEVTGGMGETVPATTGHGQIAGLHPSCQRALQHVAGLSAGPPVEASLRITLNFHPDRIASGRPILQALAADGRYLSQFVTGTSNGGLTAHHGGDRWRWEHTMFGGAYDDAPARVRPIYGALNFRHKIVGAAPRFGSAHLRLTAASMARATFCYPDSHLEPTAFAVAGRMSLIDLALADQQDELDDYIEAQVHGEVRLERDVEALVLDPSYRDTDVETAARLLPCPLEWHPGFRLSVAELHRHPEYRGQQYVDLGTELAEDGRLTPRLIGDAARSGHYDQQDLKRVWHYLARFGTPALPRP